MTIKKTTKRALLSSVLSLFLCFAMLLGTTFAWFTDSVTSGSNVIKSGNLDIEVQYTLDGENWADLDGAGDLFQKSLWEPGHTEVVALKITNAGTLALKYSANMNVTNEVVGTNKDGGEIVLSEILQVTTITQEVNQVGDILIGMLFNGANNTDKSNTKAFKAANVLDENKALLPGAAHYVGITVDMPETVGNEANAIDKDSVPSIDFGINVFATQFEYEEDSFGNQYDADATYPDWNTLADTTWYAPDATEITLTTPNELAGLAKIVNMGVDSFIGKTVVLGSNVNLDNLKWTPIGTSANQFKGTFNGNGNVVSNLCVENTTGFAGLFGYVNGVATISNFKLMNVSVNAGGYTGDENSNAGYYAGAVAGYSNGAVTISDITVTGNINISADAMYAGGIIGRAKASKITNCSVIGNDGSYIVAERWVAGISGYDNGAHNVSGCVVENINFEAITYVAGVAGLGAVGGNINTNTIKDVEIVLNSTDEATTKTYGTVIGGTAIYSYSKGPVTVYGNVCENVTCTVNGVVVDNQEIGSKYADGTDQGLVMTTTIKNGDNYYTYLKLAFAAVPKDGNPVVIELTGDTIITGKFKPAVAKGQNIILKTNGYDLIWVNQDASKMPIYNEDGTLSSVIVTAENYASYISVNAAGTFVFE